MSVASWCCKSFCVVPCVSFCTGHFVMVPLNMTYLHCLQHSLFEHLFNLYYIVRWQSDLENTKERPLHKPSRDQSKFTALGGVLNFAERCIDKPICWSCNYLQLNHLSMHFVLWGRIHVHLVRVSHRDTVCTVRGPRARAGPLVGRYRSGPGTTRPPDCPARPPPDTTTYTGNNIPGILLLFSDALVLCPFGVGAYR